MRVLVCGDRRFHDTEFVSRALDLCRPAAKEIDHPDEVGAGNIELIYNGDSGPAACAVLWNKRNSRIIHTEIAQPGKYGKQAWAVRDARLIFVHKPHLILHFGPQGHCRQLLAMATSAGVPIKLLTEDMDLEVRHQFVAAEQRQFVSP
jgi:hypothetical protein